MREPGTCGLPVALHVLMSVLYGFADAAEQLQTCLDVELMSIAVLVERLAVDVLHDEVGCPGRGDTTVMKLCDRRVIEGCEYATLSPEAGGERVGRDARQEALQRDELVEVRVRAFGDVDDAHPAAAQLPHDVVAADPAFGRPRWRRLIEQRCPLGRGHGSDR